MRLHIVVFRVYTHTEKSDTHVTDPIVHVRVSWITEIPEIIPHALKVSVSSEY